MKTFTPLLNRLRLLPCPGRAALGAIVALLGLLTTAAPAVAGPFPGQGNDSANSIAVFRIAVNPAFEPLLDLNPDPAVFAPYPGYDFVTKRLTSPLLVQPTTTIGRSAPGTTPLGTVPVGTAGTLVGAGDYSVVPPQFLNPPAGTREVRTEVFDLNLETSNECYRDTTHGVPLVPAGIPMVRGGTGQGLSLSPGLVQANQLGSDFPAKSFFNVFVQVALPAVGPFTGADLFNSDPLQVVADSIDEFPPNVAYQHEESTAVALKFKTTNPGLWSQGDVFGYMVLAGHGMGVSCESNGPVAISLFLDQVLGTDQNPAIEAPIPPFPDPGVKAPTLCCGEKPTFAQVPAPNVYSTFNGQIAAATCFPSDPNNGTYDPTSYSLVVEDLGDCNAHTGTNYYAPAFHGPGSEWTGAELGSIFGLCFDDRGNIYVTATSCYNQDIFPGGSGAIFQIDGATGNSSVFATIPSSGSAALGNIKYDCDCSGLFFVSSMDDGKIYRVDSSGTVLGGAWDHGANLPTASPAAPAIVDTPTTEFTPLGRRVWGLKPHNGRLYYAVWWEDLSRPDAARANEIWSVEIDCKTGRLLKGTQVREILLPPKAGTSYSNPVADISFGPNGTMLLSERSMYGDSFPSAHDSRMLEYTCVAGVWTLLDPSKYQLSSAPNPGSAAGGCDYDFSPAPCGRVWATVDYTVVSGQYIYGLQGLPAAGGHILNSINIDLDGMVTSTAVKTQIGDVELPCPPPKCAIIADTALECISTNGVYFYQFCVTNQFPGPISYVTLLDLPAGVTVSQDVFTIPTLQPGEGTCLSVYITNSTGVTDLCFRVGVHTVNFVQCCAIEHCIKLPGCCVQVVSETITPVQGMGGCYDYTFTIKNLTVPPAPIQYIILVPDPPNNCYSITPDIIYLATPLLPGQSVTRTVKVCSVATPPCVEPFWFLLSVHDTNFNMCCSIRRCVPKSGVPDPVGFPGGFDGTAYAEGEAIAVPVDIDASALQPASVSLYDGGELVGTVAQPMGGQYDNLFTISNAVAGTHVLRLGLTDVLEGVWVSDPVTIQVFGQMTPPIPLLPSPLLLPASLDGGQLSFSMQTEAGVTCHIEYSDSLSAPNWQVLRTLVGDGGAMIVTEDVSLAPQRFYRVRVDQ